MGIEEMQLSRRSFFRTVGVVGTACMIGGTLAPRMTLAEEAAINIDALLTEKIGSAKFAEGKVNVGTKLKPDSGSVVPVPVTIDHPMEPGNFIEAVVVVVDNNPNPYVARLNFTPEVGQVNFELQIKMAKSSKLRVVAKTNKGEYLGWAKEIEVPAGGCAG